MSSSKTNGSLNLQPMNSRNCTAAIAGVTSSDTDEQTVFGGNADRNGSLGQQAESRFKGVDQVVSSSQLARNKQLGNRVIAEEDIIPPYDSSMCTNNSLINDSSVLLASGSLDLKPQKRNTKQETQVERHAEDADVVVAPPLSASDQDSHNIASVKDNRSSDRTESLRSTISAESRGTEETERTSGTSGTNNTHPANDLNEETRQLSDSSSRDSEKRSLSNAQCRKDTLTDNTLVEKQFNTMNLREKAPHQSLSTKSKQEEEQCSSESQSQLRPQPQPQPQPKLGHPSQQKLQDKVEDPVISKQQEPAILQSIKETSHTPESPHTQQQQEQNVKTQSDFAGDLQRQAYEQRLEQKKMEQFRKLNMVENSESRGFAKSISPMSPKTTVPFAQKLPTIKHNVVPPAVVTKPPKANVEVSHAPTPNAKLSDVKAGPCLTNKLTATSRVGASQYNHNSQISDTTNAKSNACNGGGNTMACHSSSMLNNFANDGMNGSLNVAPQTAFTPPKRTQSPFRDLSNPYLKQINNQQRPLYTPAVLRIMKNTSTSPSSEVGFDVHQLPSERRTLSQSSSAVSVRSTASSIVDYWNYMTGRTPSKSYDGPTREHWKPDSSRFNCAQCGKLFNYMTENRRKHHCRSCGDIFCGDCLKNYIYLDRNAHFTLFGSNWEEREPEQPGSGAMNLADNVPATNECTPKEPVEDDKKYLCKVCLNCFQQYEEYVLDHTTRDHNLGADGKDIRKNNNEHRETAMDTKNIPVDWNWSSF